MFVMWLFEKKFCVVSWVSLMFRFVFVVIVMILIVVGCVINRVMSILRGMKISRFVIVLLIL